MGNNLKIKRIVAGEIILFFSTTILVLIVFLFLLLRNSFYIHKKDSSTKKESLILSELTILPKDRLKTLYDSISRFFVVNYKFNNRIYAIVKIQEKNFLHDEYGNKKDVILLPKHPSGYFYYKDDPLNILAKDSVLVFEYISLDSFRLLVKGKEYQDKLYSTFSSTGKDFIDVEKLFDTKNSLPVFNKFAPYFEFWDFNTIDDFENQIQLGLQYTKETENKKKQLTNEYYSVEKDVDNASSNILDDTHISDFIFYTAIVLFIILYPLRLVFLMVKLTIISSF